MAEFKTDLNDIFFNLFDMNKVQDTSSDLGVNDLKEIVNEFNKFVENELYPTRTPGDEEGVKHIDGKVYAPKCFHRAKEQFYENGWFGLGHEEEFGGMPVPQAVAIACSSIAVGSNIAFMMYPGLSTGVMNVVKAVGTKEQKDLFIPKIMDGTWGGTMCLTEPGAGSDVGAVTTKAVPLEGGGYAISGVKIFISSGESDLYSNNIHLVLAKLPGAAADTNGLSLFLVPQFKVKEDGSNGDLNNVVCTKIEEKMGIHGSATCELTFGGEGECVGELIGQEGQGMANMFIMMNEARLLCGQQGEAQANLAYELTLQYAKDRSQFGTEIINFPDVKRMLLSMRAISRGMRALTTFTGNLFDKEKAGDKVAQAQIALLTPICKAYCSDEAFLVASTAMQVHGGYGFCSEYGIEQFVRDIKIASIYEGTNGIQAIDFVMRKILKDQAKTFMGLGQLFKETMEKEIAGEFPHELSMIGKSMEMSEKMVQKFGGMIAAKNHNGVLAHATDFLSYCGNMVVAWLLLDHAIVAKEKIDGATPEMQAYYKSKIVDFKVFCKYQLVKNIGIANSVLNFEDDVTSLEF